MPPVSPSESACSPRKTLVSPATRRVPDVVRQLNEWQYLERTLHRLLCGWGAHHREMDDKAALHRHVWDQAEVIRRLRERIAEFPGGKPDAAVSPALEAMANEALFAPGFQDALDATYHLLPRALVRAYAEHVCSAHPVHDAPTIALLHEINTIKEQHALWYREYRRRHPHVTDRAYRARLEEAIVRLGAFRRPLPAFDGPGARLCGVGRDFRLLLVSGRPSGWRSRFDVMPYLTADFGDCVEARRLFWAIGYLREINLPDEQLSWLYSGDAMPWNWHHDVSRHLWDESRHGLSGSSRLQDWGIAIEDVGLPPYSPHLHRRFPAGTPLAERIIDPYVEEGAFDFSMRAEPMSAQDLYEAVFQVGMVAESGHFTVKNEAYDDFRDGRDLESAEMMLFDIIDETAHVQYAHRWLPELARLAGIEDHPDYRQRAVRIRESHQREEHARIAEARTLPREAGYGPWDHYQDLLARIRRVTPFDPDFNPGTRSVKPM